VIRPLLIIFLLSLAWPVFGQDKAVSLCTYPHWAPYVHPDLPQGGLVTDIINQAFISQGYTVTIAWMPWARALASAKNAVCDGLTEAYYTPDRALWGRYSQPYYEVQEAFYSRKNSRISYQSLADLKPYRIGFIRGASVSAEFDTASFLNKTEVNSVRQGLIMLDRNRLDLIINNRLVIEFELGNMEAENYGISDRLVIVNPYVTTRNLHVLFSKKSKNSQILILDFNRGLEKIKKNGVYDDILSKHINKNSAQLAPSH